jgi:hypothetical protein
MTTIVLNLKGQDPQWLDHPQIITGETILPGFAFTVSKLWS